jgi:hypothetical protein
MIPPIGDMVEPEITQIPGKCVNKVSYFHQPTRYHQTSSFPHPLESTKPYHLTTNPAGKIQNHLASSLPNLVENLVKNREIEASFKTNISVWRTTDRPTSPAAPPNPRNTC